MTVKDRALPRLGPVYSTVANMHACKCMCKHMRAHPHSSTPAHARAIARMHTCTNAHLAAHTRRYARVHIMPHAHVWAALMVLCTGENKRMGGSSLRSLQCRGIQLKNPSDQNCGYMGPHNGVLPCLHSLSLADTCLWSSSFEILLR